MKESEPPALVELVDRLAELIRRDPGDLDDAAVARLLKLSVRLAAATGAQTPVPIPDPDGPLTPTEVAVVASRLLEEAELDLFELALWRNWGRA